MSIRINFIRVFFYCLLGTLLAACGIGFFTEPLKFGLVFAIVLIIENEARTDAIEELFPQEDEDEDEGSY
jgi:hypothetical protein